MVFRVAAVKAARLWKMFYGFNVRAFNVGQRGVGGSGLLACS
jgi:hypothetical protein